MSSTKHKVIKNNPFVKRLIEICGTDRPAALQRLLNISYQAAKNYLLGRYPNTEMLIIISEQTGCSIDWLLTGRGKKFIDDRQFEDTPLPPGHADAFVRRICVEVINERLGSQEQPKIVVLQPANVRSEKVEQELTIPDREP
ncbi:MAG TPA: helix-turn-helix domain-containing protein [Pyrinomonadaceae bacterium]|nr:helix-turn-helix domain-containing protein [Pyrinomonadaceae bacterium]